MSPCVFVIASERVESCVGVYVKVCDCVGVCNGGGEKERVRQGTWQAQRP